MSSIRRKLKKSVLSVLTAVLAFALTGCGASVAVYDYTENGVRYNEYEISVDADAVSKMESSAAIDRNGDKYVFKDYLYALFTEFGYELTDATFTNDGYTASYRKVVAGEPELFSVGTPVSFTATSTKNPFIKTYTAVSPNPFDGVREYYDGIERGRSATMLERIKNGVTVRDEFGDAVTVFPSIAQAFPYLNELDPDGLRLDYVQTRSDRMKSSGTAERVGNRTVRYTFSRYFDYTENIMAYEYKRAVPYGWYGVAVAAGAVVFAAIMLATRKKRGPLQSLHN